MENFMGFCLIDETSLLTGFPIVPAIQLHALLKHSKVRAIRMYLEVNLSAVLVFNQAEPLLGTGNNFQALAWKERKIFPQGLYPHDSRPPGLIMNV
jgi:hypothetical protein